VRVGSTGDECMMSASGCADSFASEISVSLSAILDSPTAIASGRDRLRFVNDKSESD
jgi:hypothetical protein